MESAWRKLSSEQLKHIISEIREYIRQLWEIPNSCSDEFVVGSLCSTHELLKYERSAPPRSNGPFKTLEDYRRMSRLSGSLSLILKIMSSLSVIIWIGFSVMLF